MLKSLILGWSVAVFCVTSVPAANEGPTLDLKLDRTRTVKAGGQTIRISGPFSKGPDGKSGLAIGSTQNTPRIPAADLVGENGTIMLTFMTKPRKPENSLLNRHLLALRGKSRESIFFYQCSGETLYFTFKDYNSPFAIGSLKPIEFNRWYQAACTWDGSTVRYFLDGVMQGEFKQPYVPSFPANAAFFYMGPYIDHCTNPEPWHEDSCLIQEIKVYKRALAPAEIMAAAGVKPVEVGKQFKAFLAVPQVAAPPKVDGKLDDAAWSRASSFITLIDAQKPEESLSYKENTPKFCHNGKNLYVAFQSVFPGNYKLVKGDVRGDTEPEAWGTESFEFWLDVAGKLYRFTGNVAGGYGESIGVNTGFSGPWSYKTTLTTSIDDSRPWRGEMAIPFETLGIAKPVGSEIKVNFCRTWLGFERIGMTSLAGVEDYRQTDSFVTLKISGGDTAFQQAVADNPNFGMLDQKLQAFSGKDTDLQYTAKLLSADGSVPERQLVSQAVHVKSGSVEPLEAKAAIDSTSFNRLLFQVKDAGGQLLMQQVVPFKVVENYLDVIPAFSSAKIYLKPRYTLMVGKAGGNPVQAEVVSPSDKAVYTTKISSNDEIVVPFARDNAPGVYRIRLFAVVDGKKKIFTDNAVPYHGIGPWEKTIPEERVLPPFEPLTVKGERGSFDIGMWGRTYRYAGSPLPATVTALKQPVLTAASLRIDGKDVKNPLAVTKSAPYRVELAGKAKTAQYELQQDSWIEYDGFLWNRIRIKAAEPLSAVQLKLEIPEAMAKYLHATAAGFGAGGRRTEAITKDVALSFWPVVWIGGPEQGICWFAESSAAWRTTDATPIRIVRNQGHTSLQITFADRLAKGQDLAIEFGLIATPVKPLPKTYPFTMFGDEWAVHLNQKPPHAPVTAAALLSNERLGDGFYDLPPGAKKPTPEMTRVRNAAALGKQDNCVVFPYQAAIFMPEEYPVVKDSILEWQVSPGQHLTYQYAPYYAQSSGPTYQWFYVCPASAAANYYLYRFKELLKDIPLKGIYFDFGTSVTCSNRYHGCDGGYAIRARREFYKRMAGILADANHGEYTIVAHNSESVQIPAFTFVTHFLNGEGLRQASSTTFHFGKDLLDTYTIADFASEHSSLPWGITSSIYVPTDPLLPEFGGDKEGGPGPQEKYKFRMTKASMAGALIHNTIPSQSRQHFGWFDKVIRFYDDFKVNQAEFLPYWRNGDYVRVVQGKDIYVSFYRHQDKKELLAVISHVSKEHLDQDVTVEFSPAKLGLTKLTSAKELLTGPDPEYQRLYAETNRGRNPVELGDFGVEFKGLEGNQIRLKLKHHSVAIVKIHAD